MFRVTALVAAAKPGYGPEPSDREGRSMTLEPLLTAPLPIALHGFSALAAFLLGLSQFLLPKGTHGTAQSDGSGSS